MGAADIIIEIALAGGSQPRSTLFPICFCRSERRDDERAWTGSDTPTTTFEEERRAEKGIFGCLNMHWIPPWSDARLYLTRPHPNPGSSPPCGPPARSPRSSSWRRSAAVRLGLGRLSVGLLWARAVTDDARDSGTHTPTNTRHDAWERCPCVLLTQGTFQSIDDFRHRTQTPPTPSNRRCNRFRRARPDPDAQPPHRKHGTRAGALATALLFTTRPPPSDRSNRTQPNPNRQSRRCTPGRSSTRAGTRLWRWT